MWSRGAPLGMHDWGLSGCPTGFRRDDLAPTSDIYTQEEDPMNANQFKEKWMQFKGELKQQWGKFTDDDLQQIEGFYDRFVGKAQERYGYGDERES